MDAFTKLAFFLTAAGYLCGMPLAAQDAPKEPLILRAFSCPKGTFTIADPNSKVGARKPAPEFKPISDSNSRLDVKSYFIQLGVPFPPGSEAIYEEDASCVEVRQTPQNLELIENLCTPLIETLPTALACEISAYRIPASQAEKFREKGNLTPEAIQRLEKSGSLLNRLLCIAKSGQIAEATLQQQHGTSSLSAAPVIGADGYTSDIQLKYTLKLVLSEKEAPLEISLETNASVEDGHSVVVQLAQDATERTIVVVIRASLLNSSGWPISDTYGNRPHRENVEDRKSSLRLGVFA